MSGRNGRYLAALGGLILALGVVGHSHADPGEQHAAKQGQSEKWWEADPVVAPLPPVYKPDCAAPKNAEDAEYCEQRRASAAAEEQAKWALGQLWVGAAGVVAVVLTLIYTRKATVAAAQAAEAAAKSASASQQALERDRARLHADMDKAEGLERTGPNSITGAWVTYHVHNSGSAAATAHAGYHEIVASDGRMPDPLDVRAHLAQDRPPRTIRAKGSDEYTAALASVGMQAVSDIIEGKQHAFLRGAIRYSDPALGQFVCAYTFVWLDGRWIRLGTDGYNFDCPWPLPDPEGEKAE